VSYDSWKTGGDYHRTTITYRCPCGNEWDADGFSEYGTVYLVNEDGGNVCEECGRMICDTRVLCSCATEWFDLNSEKETKAYTHWEGCQFKAKREGYFLCPSCKLEYQDLPLAEKYRHDSYRCRLNLNQKERNESNVEGK